MDIVQTNDPAPELEEPPPSRPTRASAEALMRLVDEHAAREGVAGTCTAVGLARATYYRRKRPPPAPTPSPAPARALSSDERRRVLSTLLDERFVDVAPAAVYANAPPRGQHLPVFDPDHVPHVRGRRRGPRAPRPARAPPCTPSPSCWRRR